jgi:hypothetical protein
MTTVSSPGGLIGTVREAISAALDKPERWLIRCAILASVISVIYYSGDKAKDGATQAILVLLGLSAVGFHYIGAQKACRAWYERQVGAFALWGLIICGAIAWEVNSTLSVASNNQSNLTNAQLTAFSKSDNNAKAVADAEAKLERLRKERAALDPIEGQANIKPWRNVADARAAVNTAEAHKWFTGITEGCTVTKGPQTRDFCKNYEMAKAEVERWDLIAKMAISLGAAEQELADARKAASLAPVLATADRADLDNLRRLTGMSLEDLQLSQSLLTVLVLALFLTIAGWLVKAEEYEGRPRKPWFGRLMATLTGRPMPVQPAPVAMSDDRRKIEDRYQEIKAGEKPQAGNQNVFLRVEGKAEDALAKLADILRNSSPVGAR